MTGKKKEFTDDPSGWAKRWTAEFASARNKPYKRWKEEARKVIHRFLDDKRGEMETVGELQSKLNLFHSNVIILQSMLYGRLPKVEVDRTFADAEDDVARVAGVMLGRMLNQDIQNAGEDYSTVLRSSLQDRLLPGIGSARIKYDFKMETKPVEPILDPETGETKAEGFDDEQITDEWVDTVYTHWQDQLWSPARTYSELRWKAYRSFLGHDELVKRFGEDIADDLPKKPVVSSTKKEGDTTDEGDIDPQSEVWEIWDKRSRYVYWFVEGYDKTLDKQEDPLELEGFWPDPPPMIANLTTTRYMPRSDYAIAQDLYNEIDKLQTRISILTDACKSIGFYDKQNAGIKRAMEEGVENDLIPVDNWAMYAEKGGAKGIVDWVPLENVANTISTLTEQLNIKIQQLYQVTGMSDIMRGASQPYEAAATTKAKQESASVRVQALQDDFARFATDLQKLKVEVIQNFYQPYCIIQQSNIEMTVDGQDPMLVQQAVELIKDKKRAQWKITVRPESLAIIDYARLKADRMEYINALAMFMQSSAPLVQLDKKVVPILLELLKWGLAGFKGSNEIEGVLDKAISLFQKQADAPDTKPDPAQQKMQMEMQKMQGEAQMAREEHQADMAQTQQKGQLALQEMQQKFQLELAKMNQEMKQDQQMFQLELKKMMMELFFKKQELQADQNAQANEQATQFAFNTAEREHEAKLRLQSEDKGNGGGNGAQI